MTTTVETPLQVRTAPPRVSARLGEELPIFCEKCGYSLHGLPHATCERCSILQFHCPECGHHQPINTLRPAFQVMLGKIRAAWLVGVVLFKLNLLFWPLMGWIGMGAEWPYRGSTTITAAGLRTREWVQNPVSWEMLAAFGIFGIAFGAVGRMALLRWRHGWAVGIALAMLVLLAVSIGAKISQLDGDLDLTPFSPGFLWVMAFGAMAVLTGAVVVWPIWYMLVNVFLPRRLATLLLDWQRSMSNRVSKLSRV